MAEIVKITCGQPFVVYLPLVILNADGSKEAVDASRLTDVVVKLQAQGVDDVTVTTEAYEQYLVLNIPGTMPVAEYNIIVTAALSNGRTFTLRMSRALGVMAWDWQTNWRDYLVGEHIELCDQPFIAGEFTTDAEYEALKQQLREQIAAAEQAEAEAIAEKERYAEAIEHLEDIAQESTLRQGVSDIRNDIANIDIDTTTLAKEQTLTNGIQSILTALNPKATTADVTAAKQAILDALSHISPTDPNSLALAQFFGVTLLEGYEFMTDTEVCGELEDIMRVIDPNLTAAQAAAITAQTLNPSES